MLIRRGLPGPDRTGGLDPSLPYSAPLSANPPRALTIGSFDGLHLGHRALIDRLISSAKAAQLQPALLSFHPHPRAYFQPTAAPGLVLPFRDRLGLLKQWGLAEAWILPFNQALATMPAETFVRELLVGHLQMKHLVIGEGFRFGQARKGDLTLLQAMGQDLGFSVDCLPAIIVAGERASSSRLRDALRSGNLSLVETLLGRPYCLSGRVAHGQKLGRQLGFPTLNLRMPDRLMASGIFAVSIRGLPPSHGTEAARDPEQLKDPVVFGVASLGRRPTVEAEGRLLLEVHCFDWQGDAYGHAVEVHFHHFLRHEAHYDSLEAMTAQIHQDAEDARRLLQPSLPLRTD